MTSAVDKLAPFDDPRITRAFAKLSSGSTYHYLHGIPKRSSIRATIFLVHGWPDLSFGWRYQIPLLLDMGLQVIAPDFMGYGMTDAPRVPPNNPALYSIKRASDDIAEMARLLLPKGTKIILGGHDWGGAVVYRCAEWHPELISHVFSVATPYTPPQKQYIPLEAIVKRAPQFGYQIHLASGEVERTIQTKQQIRDFLNALYGGKPAAPSGERAFDPSTGVNFSALPNIGKSPFVSDSEMDYYVEQYSRNGLHGPCNWYRTRKINFEDELSLPATGIKVPVLFIIAERDNVLLPAMAKGIERHLHNLTLKSVPTGHWALWQAPDRVNQYLKEWFEGVVFAGDTSKL